MRKAVGTLTETPPSSFPLPWATTEHPRTSAPRPSRQVISSPIAYSLVGSLVGLSVQTFPGFDFSFENVNLSLLLFARYYFPGGDKRKVSYFGEVGFGGFYISSLTFVEPDFHFGGGAEVTLFPGVVGTALLRYDANYLGRSNAVNLTFGANVLLGQLEQPKDKAVVKGGTFTTTGNLGGAYFGSDNLFSESDGLGGFSLIPSLGFFLADGLMIEAQLSISYLRFKRTSEFRGVIRAATDDILINNIGLSLRYYPLKSGTFLPYVTGGGGYQDYWAKSVSATGFETIREFNSLFYQAGAGVNWFLSPNVALDGSIRYRSREFSNESTFSPLETIKNVQAEIGLRLFLPR